MWRKPFRLALAVAYMMTATAIADGAQAQPAAEFTINHLGLNHHIGADRRALLSLMFTFSLLLLAGVTQAAEREKIKAYFRFADPS